MAAWIATEFWIEFKGTLGITLTPVDESRFEVVVDGQTLFDRKAEGNVYPGLDKVRSLKRTIKGKLEQLVAVS